MRRTALLLSLFAAACTPPKPCAKPADEPVPAFPGPTAWDHRQIPQPAGGWIGSIALSPDGAQAVYSDAPGGNFIPTSDVVSVIRVDLGHEANASLITLPGDALRNFAWMDWTDAGIVWGSWSSLGVAAPSGSVTRFWEIPSPGKERPAFPMFTSVKWESGDDCLATTLASADKTELLAFKASGRHKPSHRVTVADDESVAAWTPKGVLLLKHGDKKTDASARWVEIATGKDLGAEPMPEGADAIAWLGGRWLTVQNNGTLRWGAQVIGMVPHGVELPSPPATRSFLRIFPAASGRAIAIEEGTTGLQPARYMHVLTAGHP